MYINKLIDFIDVNYIKINSRIPISTEVDDIYLRNAISYSQDSYIQDVLGEVLYTRFVNEIYQYNLTGTTISTEIEYLLNSFIKDCTMYCSLYESINTLYEKIMNTSIIVKVDSAISSKIDTTQLDKKRQNILSMAEWYLDRTRKYLIQASSNGLFPEYVSYSANLDTIIPKKFTAFGKSGFYFKNKRQKDIYFGPNRTFGFGNAYTGYNENMGNGNGRCC